MDTRRATQVIVTFAAESKFHDDTYLLPADDANFRADDSGRVLVFYTDQSAIPYHPHVFILATSEIASVDMYLESDKKYNERMEELYGEDAPSAS